MTDPAFPHDRHVIQPDCGRCPDLVACRTEIAWGTGPTDADVFVVGEAPAAGDPDADRWRGGNLTGSAYTSRHSGRRIRRLVDDCDYADRTYFTNAVKCFPRDRDADRETNREPTAEERRRCRDHLRTELSQVDPDVVCPTGKHATRSVLALANATIDDVADGFLDAVLCPVEVAIDVTDDEGDTVGESGAGDEDDEDRTTIQATVLPLLHPSYRDVWAPRIGYADGEAYRAAVRKTLDAATRRRGEVTMQ